ncbi:MAG TPA: hypothetical protein VFW59_08895 [Gallionella sp.]|nr:hypothetical protein [Gallionella sp.]
MTEERPHPTPPQVNAFRMKEYEVIRAEVMDRLKELWALEKFALGGASAIAAWLFTHFKEVNMKVAWWLPFIFLALCAVRFGTGMYHLTDRAAEHLIRIEKYYMGEKGSWEAWFRKQGRNETWAYLLVWAVALIASFTLPFWVCSSSG